MAGVTRDGGYGANYQSGGTIRFIPELWAGKLVEKFYDSTVFGSIANTDYEGTIKDMGDSVVINIIPTLTVTNYIIGAGLAYEVPSSTAIVLDISQAKYFAFECNDIDKYQSSKNLMDIFSSDGGEQMKIAIDTDVLATIYSDVDANNSGVAAGKISGNINLGVAAGPLQLDKTNILDFLVDCGTVLDEQSVPDSGRWIVLPSKMCGLIKKSDLQDASLAGDGTSILRNGRLGMIDRFEIFRSNLIAHTGGGSDEANIIAGHKAGLTFAAQMTKMETLRNPNDFGDYVRGLNVYGYKVLDGKYLVHAVAQG